MDRGNLPLAEEILDDTIQRSSAPRFTEVRALALHDRADVAHRRGEFERAIRLGYEAMAGLTRTTARDRTLHDIAVSFMELGVLSAARDAFILLSATAEEQYVRWAATINLMDIAAKDVREAPFEMYARELAQHEMPSALSVHYLLTLGRGYRSLGRLDSARAALERAATLAAEHSLNQLVFMAESEMRLLDEQIGLEMPMLSDVPESVRDVATAIRDMRVHAGLDVD